MEKIWYYTKNDNNRYGPYTDQELVALIRQGILEGKDFIWMTDLDQWLKIDQSIYSFYLEDITATLNLPKSSES